MYKEWHISYSPFLQSDGDEWSEFEEIGSVGINTRQWKEAWAEICRDAKVDINVLRDYKVHKPMIIFLVLQAASNTVYGEALPNLVRLFIAQLPITKNDVFYDIGSGM